MYRALQSSFNDPREHKSLSVTSIVTIWPMIVSVRDLSNVRKNYLNKINIVYKEDYGQPHIPMHGSLNAQIWSL